MGCKQCKTYKPKDAKEGSGEDTLDGVPAVTSAVKDGGSPKVLNRKGSKRLSQKSKKKKQIGVS